MIKRILFLGSVEYSTWRTRSVCFGSSVKKQTEKLKLEEKHMKKYIGTKLVQARPMTRGAYNRYRGWEIPADENPEDEGYMIQYPDGYVSCSQGCLTTPIWKWMITRSSHPA